MRKFIALVLVILSLLAVLLIFASCVESQTIEWGMDNKGNPISEWISPDGVHYWKYNDGLAPRYDSDGNLILDNSNIKEIHR